MSVTTDGLNDVYEALERYNWDDDVEFQAGLQAIIGSNSTPEQTTELALRARCFYYARKYNKTIDFDAYKSYRSARNRPPPTPPSSTNVLSTSVIDQELAPRSNESTSNNSTATANTAVPAPTSEPSGVLPSPPVATEPPAPYPTSFAHIVDLITSGKPVPGIKEIPPTVLEGQGTQATKPKRKKPWEKDEAPVEATKETGAV